MARYGSTYESVRLLNAAQDLVASSMSLPGTAPPRGPEANRIAARSLGYRGANALFVLAPDNDPFAIGRPAQVRDAEWFAHLFEEFAFGDGVHLRRIHYRIVSDGNRLLADGRPYENTGQCWGKLTAASKYARILGLVDVEAFVDRRNDPITLNREPRATAPSPEVFFGDVLWSLPEVDPEDLLSGVSIVVPTPDVLGYGYDPGDQPYLLEVWAEKSTMRDVLAPLCQRLHVNYAEAKGFESITHTAELVRRAEEHGKPVHVLYVSDYDKAGSGMPVAVSRQVQFWREQLAVEEHVSIEPIVLTAEQVAKYKLPQSPVEAATELDALEALRPGELAKIVRKAVKSWTDEDLQGRLYDAHTEAESAVKSAWDSEAEELRKEAERLEQEAAQAAAEFAPQLAQMISDQLANFEPFQQRAEELRAKAQELFERLDIDLPVRPESEFEGDTSGALFDSRRDWLDQLKVFKAHKNGGR